jgi:hypothetical protein
VEGFLDVLDWISTFAFVALGGLTFAIWQRQRDDASKWLMLTFGVLAAISIAGRFTPEESRSAAVEWLVKTELAILVLFPYFLFRFAASFRRPPRWIEWMAALLTAALVVWAFFLGELPEQNEEFTGSFQAYVILLLVQWSVLSLLVASWLWRAGRGQPEVARRRMRVLATAAALLSILLIIAGAGGGDPSPGLQVATSIAGLFSALLFYLGFSPPAIVRAVWRRDSEEALRRAVTELLSAQTEEDVTRNLLPHLAAIVGGGAVALVDAEGTITDSYRATDEMQASITGITSDSDASTAPEGTLLLKFSFGSLVVWSTPYTPFFGQEEIDLLMSLGTLAHLALERTRAAELRSRLAEAQLRREKALEINDNIVQGLAIAKYAFDLGRMDQAQQAINDTLAAARAIISDLLEQIAPGEELHPGSLVRAQPASLPRVDHEGHIEEPEGASGA